VQPVGELDEKNADILGHGEEELAEIFGLCGAFRDKIKPLELGQPVNKTANVVQVRALKDALKYVNVATQTVGVYPPARQVELRDGLASGGAQRIVRLGDAGGQSIGAPHDAMYVMHRFVHWIVHEDGFEAK